jgi:hypothetical protein
MPDYLESRKVQSTFAEKSMEYKTKQAEAADMCRSIISVIVGKYVDQILEAKSDRIEISIVRPHLPESGKKIVIEVSKDANTSVHIKSQNGIKHDQSDVWTFIEENLPDYYHRDDILHYDIYSRYLDHEDLAEGDAEWIYADFGSDKEMVKKTTEQMEKDFAYEALVNWLKNHGPECW